MFTPEDEAELNEQVRKATATLVLLLFLGKRGNRDRRNIRWDPADALFRVDGRAIGPQQLQKLLSEVERIGGARARYHTEQLINGNINVQQWNERMVSTVKASHWMAGALALGGVEAARNDLALNQRATTEAGYLGGFATDIRAGKVSPARQQSRAKSYMLAVAITFGIITLNAKKGLQKSVKPSMNAPTGVREGETPASEAITPAFMKMARFTEARRLRRAIESCSGCIEFADRWMPIDDMPPLGSLQCGNFCRCFIEYR